MRYPKNRIVVQQDSSGYYSGYVQRSDVWTGSWVDLYHIDEELLAKQTYRDDWRVKSKGLFKNKQKCIDNIKQAFEYYKKNQQEKIDRELYLRQHTEYIDI